VTKILLLGDIHARDRSPANRKEGYLDEVLDLLWQTVELEKSLGCDAVIWAGDIFDFKAPSKTSHATVLKMIEIVKAYRNLWIVTGNHDISNDVLDSLYEKQPLGVLLHAGAHELVGWHPSLPVYGVPWQQDWTTGDEWQNAFDDWADSLSRAWQPKKALVVTHCPIYPPAEAVGKPFDLVPAEDLAQAMGYGGALYYGHIHEDHGIYEVDGVTFCNPGAISRGSLHEYNVEREVKVAVWDSETGFEQIVLNHQPACDIFRMDEVADAKDDKRNFDAFLGSIGTTTLSMNSTASVIQHIMLLDVDLEVRTTAAQILETLQ
jgi:DNA repair exonuclease SbcCD nuclease subunit